jgi:hypothetical protein
MCRAFSDQSVIRCLKSQSNSFVRNILPPSPCVSIFCSYLTHISRPQVHGNKDFGRTAEKINADPIILALRKGDITRTEMAVRFGPFNSRQFSRLYAV